MVPSTSLPVTKEAPVEKLPEVEKEIKSPDDEEGEG